VRTKWEKCSVKTDWLTDWLTVDERDVFGGDWDAVLSDERVHVEVLLSHVSNVQLRHCLSITVALTHARTHPTTQLWSQCKNRVLDWLAKRWHYNKIADAQSNLELEMQYLCICVGNFAQRQCRFFETQCIYTLCIIYTVCFIAPGSIVDERTFKNYRVRPMYIEHRQYRSNLEHRRIAISKSPIPMFKIRTMYFFYWIIMNYNVVFRKYTRVNKHHSVNIHCVYIHCVRKKMRPRNMFRLHQQSWTKLNKILQLSTSI